MKYKYSFAIFALFVSFLVSSVAYAEKPKATSTPNNIQGELMSKEHRSVVSTFVQSLLTMTNREGGIGDQVREVAQSQDDSASVTTKAITKIEGRSYFAKLLFGNDYKNLEVIRSEIITTSNNLTQLEALLDQAMDDNDRVLLNAQIQALENEQVRLRAYIVEQENLFSLFGWLRKQN